MRFWNQKRKKKLKRIFDWKYVCDCILIACMHRNWFQIFEIILFILLFYDFVHKHANISNKTTNFSLSRMCFSWIEFIHHKLFFFLCFNKLFYFLFSRCESNGIWIEITNKCWLFFVYCWKVTFFFVCLIVCVCLGMFVWCLFDCFRKP